MSSRAARRLHQGGEVIRIRGEAGEDDGEEETPVGGVGGRKVPASNLFALLGDDEGDGGESSDEEMDATPNSAADKPPEQQASKRRQKKKKKKKGKSKAEVDIEKNQQGSDDVDSAIREVNELLGESSSTNDPTSLALEANMATSLHRSLLAVDRRLLNAENEMRRIFGSRVVRAEQGRRKSHQRTYHRPTVFATPKDSWPKMDKPGLSMQLTECKDGCQYFVFEHSPIYQRVQFQFLEAVETFDPNAIGAVLHAHPYHIDSLLQLSEVCKMSEDLQMATELLARALYCFECSFHPLFSYTQGNCRLNFSRAENRPFFLALFRHLYYIGRKGCHRTALEFCKLLLGLDPTGDPLGVLLMVDYHALRAGEYQFLLDLFRQWEPHRNLSQLPNFAFSLPLALFHSTPAQVEGCGGEEMGEGEGVSATRADEKLQEALIMFPSLLFPLLDKCGVTLDPAVMTHSFFFSCSLSKDPEALQLLSKLYIERSHSLWKEPEVLTWLEANARRVTARADGGDPLIQDCATKRQRRYVGTPRNIYRHVIISDFQQTVASLPRDIADTPIMMYDPLPPLDSTSGYTRPERSHPTLGEHENPFLLFLRSLLPTFNPQGGQEGGVRAGPRRQLGRMGGAPAGGGAVGGPEGAVGGALNLQPMLEQLTGALQGLIEQLRPPEREGEGEEGSSDDNDERGEQF